MTTTPAFRRRLAAMQRIGDGGGIRIVSLSNPIVSTQDGARMTTDLKRKAAKNAVSKSTKSKAELLAAIAKRRGRK